MDDYELNRRQEFQRELQRKRELAAEERQRERQNWLAKRDQKRNIEKQHVAEINNESALERLFAEAELSQQALYHEYLFGVLAP